MHEKPVVRHCPVCGTALVAEGTTPKSGDRVRLSCFNCGAVVVVAPHPDEAPKAGSARR